MAFGFGSFRGTIVEWHRCKRFGRREKKGIRELRGFGVRGWDTCLIGHNQHTQLFLPSMVPLCHVCKEKGVFMHTHTHTQQQDLWTSLRSLWCPLVLLYFLSPYPSLRSPLCSFSSDSSFQKVPLCMASSYFLLAGSVYICLSMAACRR